MGDTVNFFLIKNGFSPIQTRSTNVQPGDAARSIMPKYYNARAGAAAAAMIFFGR
jgi:hypothetical protein